MKLQLFFLLTMSASANAGSCLMYDGEVTLHGTLSKRTFPEQPEYESIENGDAAATYFFISPSQPFCVAEGDVANDDLAEPRVESVQLVFDPDHLGYDALRRNLGKDVECRGTFYHAISGHHHTPVLLSDAKCHAAQPNRAKPVPQ